MILESGEDYGRLMGLLGMGTKMIYNGGISWTVVRADGERMTVDSQAQTDTIEAAATKSCDYRRNTAMWYGK